MADFINCLICQDQPATKKNSHLIPSFLIAPIFNYDGSTKRGKEVMVTMTPFEEKVYIGELPDTKIESLFDQNNLTEERIDSELRINTAARDFIFCPKCENDLSIYLETPYSSEFRGDTRCSDDVPYFFWMSVVWRMSISGQFGVKLDSPIEQRLGEALKRYFIAKDQGEKDFTTIISESAFHYRIIRYDGYISESAGNIVASYDIRTKIFSVVIGEIIVCATFDNDDIPDSFSFFGSENDIKDSVVNIGEQHETILHRDSAQFGIIMKNMISTLAIQKAETEYQIVDSCWHKVGLPGHMPIEIFHAYMNALLDENSKLGDRMTNQRRVDVLNHTLQSFGFNPHE